MIHMKILVLQKSKKSKCVITFKQIISNKIYNSCIFFKTVFIRVALSILGSLCIPASLELRDSPAAAHKCWDIRCVPSLPGLEFLSTFNLFNLLHISTWKFVQNLVADVQFYIW